MNQPKILVVGGMHGNEQLGIKLVQLLKERPVQNIDIVIGNSRAVSGGVRYVESDLNRSFGSSFPDTYESKRAQELVKLTAAYDVVLDFHNTQTPDNNCAFTGLTANAELYEVIRKLGLTNCVEATYDCINKFCPNVVSIEISNGDILDDAGYWYETLRTINQLDREANQPITMYRFAQRVTWEQKASLKIVDWQPFVPIKNDLKRKLGLSGTIVPIFIGSKLTEYYATLLSKERIQ